MHEAYIVYPPEKISVQIESMIGFGELFFGPLNFMGDSCSQFFVKRPTKQKTNSSSERARDTC